MTFTYTARIVRVVDADTLDLDIDLGLDVHTRARVRLAEVNAPEASTPEGRAARAYVDELVARNGTAVVVRTVKDRREKYGRYLAHIRWPPSETTLSAALLEAGHAAPYGKGKRPGE